MFNLLAKALAAAPRPALRAAALRPSPLAGLSDPVVAGLRLGPENNAMVFSASTTGSQGLGATFGGLGVGLFRAILLPANYANIPASGDHWLMICFRTAAIGSSSKRQETLLGVQGSLVSSGKNFGGLYFTSPAQIMGSISQGQDISTVAGLIQCQRKNGVYSLWPQTTAGAATGLQLAPDTDYALFFGIHAVSGADYGEMILVKLSDQSCQTAQSPQALSAKRVTSAALFDQIGAVGAATATIDAMGFGGCVGDFAVWTAPFPTLAQAQSIASGATAITAATTLLGSGALLYWNTLNATALTGASLPAQVGPAATVVGSNILSSAPIRNASLVSLNRLGAHYVFPMACGASSGNAWLEGSAPAGAIVSCQLNYVGGGQSAKVNATANAVGAYAAGISSPGGRPFYRQVTLASGGTPLIDGDIMDVGIVIPILGQSECATLFDFSGVVAATVTDNATSNTGHSLPMPGAYTGPWASWVDVVNQCPNGTQYRRNRGEGARPQIMLGNGMPGDGAVQACTSLIAQLGYSVMLVMLTRSGTAMDAMIWDGQSFTLSPPLSGAGSTAIPFAGVLAITRAAVVAKCGNAGMILTRGFLNGVAPGSVVLTFPNGGSPVTVTDVFTGYLDGVTCVGRLVGDNGAAGTINYMTGQISLGFATPPMAVGYAATWTVKQESLDTSYVSKTTNINGWGVRQSVDQVAALGLRYGWSFGWHWWVTSNMTDTNTVAGLAADLSAKNSLLQQMMTGGANYPGYLGAGLALAPGCAAPPLIVAPKGRETHPYYMEQLCSIDIARQAEAALWPTGSSPLPFALPGAWYYDYTLNAAVGSAHPDHSDQGGRRVGRRMASDWVAAFTRNRAVNRGPEWGAPSFSGPVCTVPLAYIGPGLTLTTPGASGALDEWYMGAAKTLGTIVDNGAYATAAIRADGLAVTITKATGNWLGSEVVRYVVGAPGPAVADVVAPGSLIYDNRGGFGGFEPGLPAAPKFL